MTIIQHNLIEINYLKKFSDEIKSEQNVYIIKNKLKFLLDHYRPLNFTVNLKNGLFFRARKLMNRDSFDHVQELGAPPSHLTQPNRLNSLSDPIYYLTRNMLCAFDEIDAKEGEIIQVICYEGLENNAPRCVVIGEIKNVFRRGVSKYDQQLGEDINKSLHLMYKENKEAFLSYVFTDSFLSDLLTDINAKNFSYIHTQHLFRLLQNKYPDIQGILYDGIASGGAINMALDVNTAESYLVPIYTITVKILNKYGYGMYRFETIKKSKHIYSAGEIYWA